MIHICAMNLKSIAFIFLLFMSLSAGFVINRMTTSLPIHTTRGNSRLFSTTPVTEESTFLDKTVKVAETLFAGLKKGDNFKLALADAFASLSSYDPEQVLEENLLISKSHPVVMFSWTNSPSCKKAKKLLALAEVKPFVVELDEDWGKGNPIRAVLGRHLKKTSVPMIFIGGRYVGGCDDGPSDEAPGLVPLAFKNLLYTRLKDAGALSGK